MMMIVMMLIKPSSFLTILLGGKHHNQKRTKYIPNNYPTIISKGEEGFQDILPTLIPSKKPLLESSSTALVSSLVKVGFALAISIPSRAFATGLVWIAVVMDLVGFLTFSRAIGVYLFWFSKK